MREILIELLLKLPMGKSESEVTADYLLENGVVVPLVYTGQRVWFLQKNTNEVCEATVIRIEYNYFTSPQEWVEIEYYSQIFGEHTYKSRIDLILGKTVFLSREEAEKALKRVGGLNEVSNIRRYDNG